MRSECWCLEPLQQGQQGRQKGRKIETKDLAMFHKDLSPANVSQWVPRKPSSWITYQPLTESAVLFRKNDENWPYRMIPSMGSLVSCSWPPSHLDSDGNKQKLAWALAGHHLPINNLGFQGVFVWSKTTCERSLFRHLFQRFLKSLLCSACLQKDFQSREAIVERLGDPFVRF